jgi:hypothetical protein
MSRKRPVSKLPLRLFLWLVLATGGTAAALAAGPQAEVRFFAEPQETLWVGEEATLNLELWSDGFSFGGQTFSLPEVKGAFLMQPDATTVKLSERRGGTTWQGLRYPLLLFTQRGGRLEVPPFDISFEVSTGFGQPVSKFEFRTPPLTVEARLPPGVQQGELLVTSSAVDFESSWTPQPAGDEPLQLRVGDALSLRVERRAERVPGMVFPPLPVFEVEGLAAYPDKPRVADRVDRGALVGMRSDSIIYICEQEGRYELPAIRFQWWDPQRQALSEQLVEPLTVEVVANPAFGAGPAPGAGADEIPARRFGAWKTLGAALLALALLLYPGRRLARRLGAGWRAWRARVEAGEAWAFGRVRRACRGSDAGEAYRAISTWLGRIGGAGRMTTLTELARVLGDDGLSEHSRQLQVAMLNQGEASWNGPKLIGALQRARNRLFHSEGSSGSLRPLNPGPGPRT